MYTQTNNTLFYRLISMLIRDGRSMVYFGHRLLCERVVLWTDHAGMSSAVNVPLNYMCMIHLMFVVYDLVNLYTIQYLVSSVDNGLRLLLRRCVLQYPTGVHRAADPAVNIPTWVSVHYILHRQNRLVITAANGISIYRGIFPYFSLIHALFAGCTGCICYDIRADILLPELRCQCHYLYHTQCGVQRLA